MAVDTYVLDAHPIVGAYRGEPFRPKIQAPSITLYGMEDGVAPPATGSSPAEQAAFVSLVARRVIAGVGHFMPRERPEAVSSALLELLQATR